MLNLIISVFIIVFVMSGFAYLLIILAWKVYKKWLKRNDKFLEDYYNPQNKKKSTFNRKSIFLPFILNLKKEISENINKGINKLL